MCWVRADRNFFCCPRYPGRTELDLDVMGVSGSRLHASRAEDAAVVWMCPEGFVTWKLGLQCGSAKRRGLAACC